MKKIVFVHLYNDRSGSPNVLSKVLAVAQKNNITFELITSSHTDGFLSDVNCKTVTVFYRRSENKLVTLIYYIASQVDLFFLCLKYFRSDVVFYINTMMPAGAAISALLIRKQVIYHIHETSVKPKSLKVILKAIIKLTSDNLIFPSNFLKGVERYPDNKKQFVVHNSINSDLGAQSNLRKQGGFRVLMISSLKKYKGIDEFIKLAKGLETYSNIEFLLVLNASAAEISEYFIDTQIPKSVEIFSRQLSVSRFYLSSDLVLNLSRPDECVESFGLTILEGMHYGLPTIAPPVGGPAEIIRNGLDGYLISCYEQQEIQSVILKLSQDHILYNKLSLQARQRAADFSPETFEKGILNILSTVQK